MDDLVQFLRDRFSEDVLEALNGVDDGAWTADGGSVYAGHPTQAVVDYTERAAHIARHDPARVLRDAEAKQQMVDASPVGCPPACRNEHTFSGSCTLRALGPAPARRPFTSESTLRLLALPYADHPDYRDAWRP